MGVVALLVLFALAAPVDGAQNFNWGWFNRRRRSQPDGRQETQSMMPEVPPVPAGPEPVAVQLHMDDHSPAVEGDASAAAKADEAVQVDTAGLAMLDKWLVSGRKKTRELKGLFRNDTTVNRSLVARCGMQNISCSVRQLDTMLCEALEVAGLQGMLGSPKQIEGVLKPTMNRSSAQFGVNTSFRTAMLKQWEDLTWPASSRDDGSAFARLMTRTLKSAPLQALVGQTCHSFANETLDNCKQIAPRALFCQALAQTAARLKDADELVPILVDASKLRGDAQEIASANAFAGLSDTTQTIVNTTMQVSFDNWLRSGVDADRMLRAKCFMGHAMRQEVDRKCADPLGDCALQVFDSMLCGSLQRLGDSVVSPEIEKGINTLVSDKDGSFSLEIMNRRALLAKFRAMPNGTRGPETDKMLDPADYKLAAMKKRVLATSEFEAAVSRTCVPLNRIRPSCWNTAPTYLFCQALSRATAEMIGPAELFKLMQARKAMVPN